MAAAVSVILRGFPKVWKVVVNFLFTLPEYFIDQIPGSTPFTHIQCSEASKKYFTLKFTPGANCAVSLSLAKRFSGIHPVYCLLRNLCAPSVWCGTGLSGGAAAGHHRTDSIRVWHMFLIKPVSDLLFTAYLVCREVGDELQTFC